MPDEPDPSDLRPPLDGSSPSSTHFEKPTSGSPAPSSSRLTSQDSPASRAAVGFPDTAVPGDNSRSSADATLSGVQVGARRHGGGRIPRYAYRDLSKGSIPGNLWSLSWPQVLEGMLNVVDQMVDLVWAGRLPGGHRAIAGVGVSQSFTQFGFMARQGLDQSMRAMIARAVGAGNIPLANHVALQAFTLTFFYALLMVALGLFLTNIFLRGIGVSEAVQSETGMYMRVQFVGMAAIAFRMMTGAALQASGDVISPLKATSATRLTHIALTPFLMFGWWWFPSLGLAGAALANGLAQLLGCSINFYSLFRGNSRLHLSLRSYRVDYPLLWRMLKIGAPASLAGTERAVSQLILLRVVAPFGDVALAAYALSRRVEHIANFGSQGIGQASGIMVGQNLGAGEPDRSRKSVGWGLVYSLLMISVVGIPLLVFSPGFVRIFTGEADVVNLAADWIRIMVAAAVFMGMSNIFQQSYNVAGDTLAPLGVTFVGVFGVELPLAWLLSHSLGLGPLGVGYAGIAGMATRLFFYVPYFYWGRWMRVKVI